ncbi:MAG: hypothetical protein RBT71_01545 [Flavobacteriales bacterium]|nr:hypothetical protein [Flavobacteriales bacterium]
MPRNSDGVQRMSLDKGARLDLTSEQVKELVMQLPQKERLRIMKEVSREALGQELLVLAESFRTDDGPDEETIKKEVDTVRAKRYAKKPVPA